LESVPGTIYALVESLAEYEPGKRAVAVTSGEMDQLSVAPDPAESPVTLQRTADLTRQAPSAVWSVAGRGPLDEPAASILVQLLAQRNIGAQPIKFSEVSRDNIENLDVSNVKMVCISYLNISGVPAHLRYLVRRLRERLPGGAQTLIGLWHGADAATVPEGTRAIIDADYFARSFEEVLKSCQSAAITSALPAER
jgi:hypothetical protein